MTKADGNQAGEGPQGLPSPAQASDLAPDSLIADKEAFFSTLEVDQIAKPDLSFEPILVTAGVEIDDLQISASPVIPDSSPDPQANSETVAQVETADEQLADQRTKLPTPTVPEAGRVPKKRKRRKIPRAKKHIPMARREPEVRIEERDDEPFHLFDLLTWKGIQRNTSFFVSLVLHTFLIVLLSLLVVRSGIGDSKLFLEVTSAPSQPDDSMLEDVDIEAVTFDLDLSAADDPLDSLSQDQQDADEAALEQLATADDLRPSDLKSSQPTSSSGREKGDGKSATFFGSKASGRRFVFVVDRSTSMLYGSYDFRSNELFNRFDVASSELVNAIESLQPHQEFFVLMFAHNTYAMFGKRSLEETRDLDFEMFRATTENKARLQNWLATLTMGPGTDPRLALQVAIKMKPDAIFMLSDGQFVSEFNDSRPKTLDIVRDHESKGSIVPINTTSLVVEDTIPVMQEIAERSNGLFSFITIGKYIDPPSRLRGSMRLRAIGQLLADNIGWEDRAKLINENLLPMLRDSSALERANGEALLHRATMGLFRGQVDSVFSRKSQAFADWTQIFREIDGFHQTGQVSALGQGREDQQQILHATLELEDGDSLYGFFDKLDYAKLDSLTMVEMVGTIQQAHRKFGATPESIGWLRFLIARLSGKSAKAGPKPVDNVWSDEQAQLAIEELFEGRRKKVAVLYRKLNDKKTNDRVRERLEKSIVEKYPESREAVSVRMEMDKERIRNSPVSLPERAADDEASLDPFAQ